VHRKWIHLSKKEHHAGCMCAVQLHVLLYIELTISFLIGRKCTVNFWSQCLWRFLAADYTIIMSRTLKVTGGHIMYNHGAWFLRVIEWSSHALCCLPSVKKQKHDFHFFSVQCIIYKKIIRFRFFVISRIIKVSVRDISQSRRLPLPQPWLFWLSQKPHPTTIVYTV